MEEMFSRAETILQALRNEGCPDTEGIFNRETDKTASTVRKRGNWKQEVDVKREKACDSRS